MLDGCQNGMEAAHDRVDELAMNVGPILVSKINVLMPVVLLVLVVNRENGSNECTVGK